MATVLRAVLSCLLLCSSCQNPLEQPPLEDPIRLAVLKHIETCPTTQDMVHVFAWEEPAFQGAEDALGGIGVEVTADRSIFSEYRPIVIVSALNIDGAGFRKSNSQRIPIVGYVHFEHFEGVEDCPVEVTVMNANDGRGWRFPDFPNDGLLDEIICTF